MVTLPSDQTRKITLMLDMDTVEKVRWLQRRDESFTEAIKRILKEVKP